ncbi:UNVERIFIED_CONTAM: hypothetical protein FKN15_032037 [Acipenser sinensis]
MRSLAVKMLSPCLVISLSFSLAFAGVLNRQGDRRNLFTDRGCCKRHSHFIYVGQDISGSPVSVDVGVCRSHCGGSQRNHATYGSGYSGYSKHTSMLDFLRTKKLRERPAPELSAAAGLEPSCPAGSVCEPTAVRVERVLLFEGLREVEVIDECRCEASPVQCVRMPALKTFFFETPYETVIDTGKCSSPAVTTVAGVLNRQGDRRNLFTDRGCCKRHSHFIYVGQDISGSPVSVDVGVCRSHCGGSQRNHATYGSGYSGYSKHTSMLDFLRTKKLRERPAPELSAAAGLEPSCPAGSVCEPTAVRVERVLLFEGLREVEVIDECRCEASPVQCVRMPALKTFFFETPYETVIDTGKCSSPAVTTDGFSCVPTKFQSVLVESPNKVELVQAVETCELKERCYRVPYLEYYYETVYSANGVKEEKLKQRERPAPELSAAAGLEPSCPAGSVCEPTAVRVARVLLFEGLREVEVIDECRCEASPVQCVRMPALKTFFFETPYETVIDTGKCSSPAVTTDGFSCVPTKFQSVLVESPNKVELVQAVETCELKERCYRVPYRSQLVFSHSKFSMSVTLSLTCKTNDGFSCVPTKFQSVLVESPNKVELVQAVETCELKERCYRVPYQADKVEFHDEQVQYLFNLSTVAKKEKVLTAELHLFKMKPRATATFNRHHFCQTPVSELLSLKGHFLTVHDEQVQYLFNLSTVAKKEKVLTAELHLFKMKPRATATFNRHHFCQVSIYQVLDVNNMNASHGRKLLSSRLIPIHSSGWEVFSITQAVSIYQVLDVNNMNASHGRKLLSSRLIPIHSSGWEVFSITQAVRSWAVDEHSNHGLLVKIRNLGGTQVEPSPVHFASGRDHHQSKQPMLVLFTDDGRRTAALESTLNDLNNDDPGVPSSPQGLKPPNSRSVRSLEYSEEDRLPCQRDPLYVDFEEIGWSGWIISPRGYNAYHCKGSCPFPLGQNMRPTNHATVQSIINALKLTKGIETPCCVPDKLFSINLLYFDDDENVVLKQYDDMVAGSCGCH